MSEGDAEAARIAWVKRAVCDGLNLEGKHFDDLVEHTDGEQLRAFLKEDALSSEAWLLLYAAEEIDGLEEEEEEEEEPAAAAPSGLDPERLAELAPQIKQAAKDGNADKVTELLGEGVPIDVQDDAGYTPLVRTRPAPPVPPWLPPVAARPRSLPRGSLRALAWLAPDRPCARAVLRHDVQQGRRRRGVHQGWRRGGQGEQQRRDASHGRGARRLHRDSENAARGRL